MAARKTYHHGDLRQALIMQALSLLEEAGLEGLSLRKIAARTGVSHAAPEHHFPTLRHLLSGLAADGFVRFRTAMLAGMPEVGATDAERLRAAMQGYLAFVRENPQLFRLMFTKDRLDWEDPALGQAGEAARAVLADISRPVAIRLGRDTPEGRVAVEHLVWAQVHGYAHLMIDGKVDWDTERAGLAQTPQIDPILLFLPE